MYKKVALVSALVLVLLVVPFVNLTSFDSTILNFKEAPAVLKRIGFKFYVYYYADLVSPTEAPELQFPEDSAFLNNYLYSELSYDSNTKLALLRIKTIDKPNSLFGLILDEPKYLETAGSQQYAWIDCPQDKTYMVSDFNKEYLGKDIDFLNTVEPNDSVVTYCLTDECDKFGGSCILVKNSLE